MRNPFMYGKPVVGDYYFRLPYLEKELGHYIQSSISVVIVGSRRHGKTSFLKNYLSSKRKEKYSVVEIDAFNVTTHKDFLTQLINSISKEKRLIRDFVDWLGKFKSIRTHLNYDINPISGEMSLSVNLDTVSETDTKQAILNAIDSIANLSKKVIVSIDEFQEIGRLDDDQWLEATLRTKMQEHLKVSFIYTGSRRSIIEEMFNNERRPFYKSCRIMQFPSFGPEFTDWIVARFLGIKIQCDPLVISYLRQQVADTPHYVQEVCFHLVSHGIKKITQQSIDDMIDIVSSQSSYTYEAFLNTLTRVQVQILRMLVAEEHVKYTQSVQDKYEIKSASYIQAGVKALVEKQIIEKEPGSNKIIFDDPMFKIWLRKKDL